ncbi:MAG TPA: GAF and ANTAR domain-containing protein [Pseudonocardiaceae bacterium]|jgi:transcriptional regulator with GAF, ATPase, and Fis domain|nr:GAF and ANTAR domain-containing protein [Pseudonocardiaceae bacterium]
MSVDPARHEQALAAAFVGLADTLVADYDVIDLLHRLATECVHLLPVDAAGLLLSDQRGSLRVVSSSSEQARLVELFQLEANEGPCLECFRTSQPVAAADGAEIRARWPRFAVRVEREGFRSLHALPLRLRRDTIGALNLFRVEPGRLSADDAQLAQALADVATIGILHERVLRQHEVVVEQLQGALNSRVVIEQAKGVLAERGGLEMGDAFTALRSYARQHNQRLSDVAQNVVEGSLDTGDMLERHRH